MGSLLWAAIGYPPTAGLLLFKNHKASSTLPALVMANPRPVPDGAISLMGSVVEANAIMKHLGSDHARLYTESKATESSFKSFPSELSLIHLACHAFLNDRRPSYSRLALSPDMGEDGWLHAYEIEDLLIKTPLVVLSACETMGSAGQGEGLLGLSRAFFLSGARAVVATAWVVDDQATAFLMERFYGAVTTGQTPIQALQTAQISTLKQGQRPGLLLSHPFFWAGFLYLGNP